MSPALSHILRVARYARNSDDAARRVADESPRLVASDWPMTIEAARLLLTEGLSVDDYAEFSAADAFAVHFLAGYARACGRHDAYTMLGNLSALMWGTIDGREGNAVAA